MRKTFPSSPIATIAVIAAAAAITAVLLFLAGVGRHERRLHVGQEPGEARIDETVRSLAENTLRTEPRTCQLTSEPGFRGFEIRVDDGQTYADSERQLLSQTYTEELERACGRESNQSE